MNNENSFNPFWPISIMAASLIIILSWQITLSLGTRAEWRAQFEQRKQAVDQSSKVQTGLENLVNDLLELAKTDATAKSIVDKYQIRKNDTAK